jgi:glycosyltransferase involved in cell wall biosynthesis
MILSPRDPAQPRYGYRPATIDAPAVGIITPYYNTGALFMETVQSVLCQSLQQWEWLIVNDGSDDPAALRALLPLRNADRRIAVLDRPHLGVSAARNYGVAVSSAPLLFFLDSDDLLAPTALEKLAWTLVSRPRSAFSNGWSVVFGQENLAWPRGFDTRYAFPYENIAPAHSMVRRGVFDQVGGFNETRRQGLEDFEFWLSAAAHGFWGHDVHEFLIWSRRKARESYTSYRWSFLDDPRAIPTFQREMRARYPQVFRDGAPAVADNTSFLETHALIASDRPFANRLERPSGQRRVLQLLPWIRLGGADRFALDVAAGLTARGDRVTACLLRDTEHAWLGELQRISTDVFNLPAFLAPADYPRFLHYLIESRQITTVLISNSLLAYQLLPYLRAHCPHVAFVDYLHAEEPWRDGGFPRGGVEHDGLLDMHIVSSEHLRRWMIARGAAPERIAVCTINVDAERWRPAAALRARVRAELGIADDLPLMLFVGRLAPEKRPQMLAEVLRRLHRSGAPFLALIVGDGEDRIWLRYFVYRHGLRGHVRLLGDQPHQRVYELLAASDLLLLPSEREGIAMSLYEALAMGVVPVAADVGGQRELVTPECGVLIPHGPDEPARYVAALRDLIADPALRARMAEAGRARILARFTAGQMLDRMQALLDQAVACAGADPQPPVGHAAGQAAATLAIEHYQLDARLRALPPVRLMLALRQSYAWKLLTHLRGLRAQVDATDRALYTARREVMQRLRRITRRRS